MAVLIGVAGFILVAGAIAPFIAFAALALAKKI